MDHDNDTTPTTGRRAVLASGGTALAAAAAGCIGGGGGGGGGDGTGADTTTTDQDPFADIDTLTFGMSPTEPQDYMMAQYGPVADHLTEALPVGGVELQYSASYTALLQALGSGQVHVGETGPFAAALGVRTDPPRCEILLQRYAYGSWKYTSVLVTREETDITAPSDVAGATVAFADKLSASGSLFPLFMLKQAGVSIGQAPQSDDGADFTATWTGHSTAFQSLANGQADVAGVGQFITLNDNRELKDGFRYVDKTGGIPRAPIVGSPELTDEESQAVVDAFRQAPSDMYLGENGVPNDETGEDMQEDDLWFSDVRPADRGDYEPVITVADDLNLDIEQFDN